MTVAISIERYIGIHYSWMEKRKGWFYIIPVILISVILNVPMFFEKQVITLEEDGKIIISETWTKLRREPTYILGIVLALKNTYLGHEYSPVPAFAYPLAKNLMPAMPMP